MCSVGLLCARWSFLEAGIESVMLNLDAGIDMKTVSGSPGVSISHMPY